jgi:hypothetical protein
MRLPIFRRIAATFAVLLTGVSAAAGETRVVRFQGEKSDHRWTLREVNPDLPSNWTPYGYLVIEMKASSPQRFFLRLYDAGGMRSVRLQPFSGVWIRASLPLKYFQRPDREGFDLASLGNKSRNCFWMGVSGPHGSLDAVEAIGVTMEYPIGGPTLEIRSIRLAKDDPGSDMLESQPVIDRFGQWMPADWPDKIKSLEQLRRDWAAEEKQLGSGDFDYCQFGGYRNTKANATGFFRVQQVDGRWWFVDPDGHLFFSTSANGMRGAGAGTRTEGRESYFVEPPPANLIPAGAPGGSQGAFYSWNIERRFGPEWNTRWVDLAIRRLESWGLNTIGNWSDPKLWDAHRKAYLVFLRGWGMESGYMGMPDVYSPEFPDIADRAAAGQCAPRKDDPYLLGYFIGNEPPWPGRESLVVDTILERPPSAIQSELKAFLAAGDTPERRKAFVYRAFDRYLEVVNAAVRKYDPNHLNLGLRFGGSVPPPEIVRASRSFSVYSMNVYAYSIDPRVLDKIYEATGRPILIGEFHIGTPGRGLAAGLVQAANQEERGVAYRYYVEQAAAHPAFIGTGWFQWIDQPATGRGDGENYNIGFVDVSDRPYREMVDSLKATHRRLYAVHAGKVAPFDRKARAQ